MKKFRIAHIGLDKMGGNFARVLLKHPGFIVSDIVTFGHEADRPEWVSEVKMHTTLETLGPCDLVVVASAAVDHYGQVKYLLNKNFNVFVEKPLSLTQQQGQELVKIAAEKALFLRVGFVERSNPVVQKLKEIINSGVLGEVIHVSATRVGGYPENAEGGNNVLMDLALHDIEVVQYLCGPLEVYSSLCHSTKDPDLFDTAQILFTANRGKTSVSIHVNWLTPTKIRTLRITGTKGVCFVDYVMQTAYMLGGDLMDRGPEPTLDFEQVISHYSNGSKIEFGVQKEEPLKVLIDHLHQCLCGNSEALPSLQEALNATALAEESMEVANIKWGQP